MGYFETHSPCSSCPFRTDIPCKIERREVQRLRNGLTYGTFTCLETTIPDPHRAEEVIDGPDARHCAGALIMLTRIGTLSNPMKIAQKSRSFQPESLHLAAPVYESWEAMLEAAAIDPDPPDELPISAGTKSISMTRVIGSILIAALLIRVAWDLYPVLQTYLRDHGFLSDGLSGNWKVLQS